MPKVKGDETYAEWAHGYVTDCLYHWGRQVDLIRVFAKQQTGFYNQSSSALKRPRNDYSSEQTAPILDEVYIRLDAPLKAVMRVEYKDCVDDNDEMKAFRCGVSRRTYKRRLLQVIAAAQEELLNSARKIAV